MDAGDGHAEKDVDETLAGAICDLGIALTGETAVWEEGMTVDTPLSTAAERVHTVLAATRHPLHPGLPVASGHPREISWIAGRGGVGGELSPVLITVNLTSSRTVTVSKDRTEIMIRGAAREQRTSGPWSAARTAVDMLVGILADHFNEYDIVDFTG